jgi:hypothetical protein
MCSLRSPGAGQGHRRMKAPGEKHVCPIGACSQAVFEKRLTSSNNYCAHGPLVRVSDLKYTFMCPLKKRDEKAGCAKTVKTSVKSNANGRLKCDCPPGLPMVRK